MSSDEHQATDGSDNVEVKNKGTWKETVTSKFQITTVE